MLTFESVRSHIGSHYTLRTNDPYLISFDLDLRRARHQGMDLVDLEGDHDRKYLRVSTPIAPLTGVDMERCLRFNWAQRAGFLAISDLEGSPYLHLCENRPYDILDLQELERLIREMGVLGDQLEQVLVIEGDTY